MFRNSIRFMVLFIAVFTLLFFVSVAMAQESGGPIDWEDLGVNVAIIVPIIAVVQMVKKYIPEKLVVFAPIILSVGAFFVVPGERPVYEIFYWAAAAGYLWKMANTITPESVLKSKTTIGSE